MKTLGSNASVAQAAITTPTPNTHRTTMRHHATHSLPPCLPASLPPCQYSLQLPALLTSEQTAHAAPLSACDSRAQQPDQPVPWPLTRTKSRHSTLNCQPRRQPPGTRSLLRFHSPVPAPFMCRLFLRCKVPHTSLLPCRISAIRRSRHFVFKSVRKSFW